MVASSWECSRSVDLLNWSPNSSTVVSGSASIGMSNSVTPIRGSISTLVTSQELGLTRSVAEVNGLANCLRISKSSYHL